MPAVSILYAGPQTPAVDLPQFAERQPRLEELQEMVGGYIQQVYFEDDPMAFWHVGYVNEEGLLQGLPPNLGAEARFPQYEGLLGNCVVIEGVGSWWYDMKTDKKIRLATKEEALRASQTGRDHVVENGVHMYISEDDEG